jgi:hypothetical protein
VPYRRILLGFGQVSDEWYGFTTAVPLGETMAVVSCRQGLPQANSGVAKAIEPSRSDPGSTAGPRILGATVASNAGLLAHREIDDVLQSPAYSRRRGPVKNVTQPHGCSTAGHLLSPGCLRGSQ